MATISENLQILKDSTDAIKQAIIDKGGTINGDITTWASAISGIETGGGSGSSNEEYVFTGTISYNMSKVTKVTFTGNLNKVPDTDRNWLVGLWYYTGGVCIGSVKITGAGYYALTVNFNEPLIGREIPAICILSMADYYTYNVIPVKFQETISTNPA